MATQDITNKSVTVLGLYSTTAALHVAGGISGTARLDPDIISQQVIDLLTDANEITAAPYVAPVAPSNTVLPAVTGTAEVGQVLTSTTGTWSGSAPITYSRQWQRGTTNISGATGATYTAVPADAGQALRCVVTATNVAGSASANSNATAAVTSAPANTVAPAVTGTATVGQTLTTTNGTWTGSPAPTFTRQWQRGSTNISGATGVTYVLVAADAGQSIRCVVTATNTTSAVAANSNATATVTMTPANTVAPALTGTPTVGQTVTVTNGTWTGSPTPTFTRVWQRSADGATGWTAIVGQTAATYVLTEDDVTLYVRATVTATNTAGNATASSNAIGPVIVDQGEV